MLERVWRKGNLLTLPSHTHKHTMEYYSAIKKNEMLPSAATWMNLEIIILGLPRWSSG